MFTRLLLYKDRKGRQSVLEFLNEMRQSSGKDARINLEKALAYMRILDRFGTTAGEPFMKHLKDDIWELRPLKNRILFAGFTEGKFVLLHVFTKKTRKTPQMEIEKAEKELKDFKERYDEQ